MQFNYYLQESISGMLGRCAVPLFYAISGYLFFLNTDKGISVIRMKMKKRVWTLLIPFVIAALYFPAFLIGMELLPFTKQFVNGTSAFSNNLQLPLVEIIRSLFYAKNGGDSPWAFHLWFLRDLIIIVAISPLLYVIKKAIGGGISVLVLYILTFLHIEWLPLYALFWFMAGSVCLNRLDKVKSMWIPVIFMFISVMEFVLPDLSWKYIKIPVIALGIVSVWNIYNRLLPASFNLQRHRLLCTACQFTFFIYLFHEPTLNIVRKLLILVLGHTSTGFALSYMLSPWIFAGLFIVVGYYFRKFLPRIYAVCTGGR